jgi:hypothetical protein
MQALISLAASASSIKFTIEVWPILAVFALMFLGITIAALWYAHSSDEIKSRTEIKKKKIDVVDKHYLDMLRIECPYCKTIYRADEPECPNCKASVKNLIFPEIPE